MAFMAVASGWIAMSGLCALRRKPMRAKFACGIENGAFVTKARFSRFDCSPGRAVEATIGLTDGKWKSAAMFRLPERLARAGTPRGKGKAGAVVPPPRAPGAPLSRRRAPQRRCADRLRLLHRHQART